MKRGSTIKVKDKKDGLVYKCKVANIKDNKIKIHYVNWSKSRDEWLNKTDPRIVSGAEGNSRSQSLQPSSPSPLGRTSVEKQIDELYNAICSQPVTRNAENIVPSKRKRSAEPDNANEHARQRSLIIRDDREELGGRFCTFPPS